MPIPEQDHTASVRMTKLTEVPPEGTVTVAGIFTVLLLECKEIVTPVLGAGWFSSIVAVVKEPPFTV